MKDLKEQQIVVITETDPTTFQLKVNKAMQEHAEINNIEYKDNIPGVYCAIVTYTEYRQEPENAADEYQLAGKRYMCNDCPHLELDPDRRSYTHYCNIHRDRVALKQPACEDFLKALKAGAEHLVTTEERQAQYDEMDRKEIERRRKKHNEMQRQFYLREKRLELEKEIKKVLDNKTSEKYHFRKTDI